MTALLILASATAGIVLLVGVLALLRGGAQADEARTDAQALAALAAERARLEMRETVRRLLREQKP